MGYILPTHLETKLLTWSLLHSWLLAALGSAVRVGFWWVVHFPPSMAVASEGGRTHKVIFPRQIELAATAKTILGVSQANLARGQAKPFLVHLPNCYWI